MTTHPAVDALTAPREVVAAIQAGQAIVCRTSDIEPETEG